MLLKFMRQMGRLHYFTESSNFTRMITLIAGNFSAYRIINYAKLF